MIKGNELQIIEKNKLYSEIKIYEQKIKIIENKIKHINNIIIGDCFHKNGSHIFKEQTDDGPYPETFCICINCGYEQ